MAEIKKGTVTWVFDDKVKIKPMDNDNVTPFILSNGFVLQINDTVAYVLWGDGTGFVLAKL